uniref:Uncharacterized protein n=1 Tax=Eptatretus burgeri TaxID=7764 RepID=A0A8C4Q8Y3_EPTBU
MCVLWQAKELESLHHLRKTFMNDLLSRAKKADAECKPPRKVSLLAASSTTELEKDLQQLSKFHHNVMQENRTLKTNMPYLQSRLNIVVGHVQKLETALEAAHSEVESTCERRRQGLQRIREMLFARGTVGASAAAEKLHSAQIAKPIIPGQRRLPWKGLRSVPSAPAIYFGTDWSSKELL